MQTLIERVIRALKRFFMPPESQPIEVPVTEPKKSNREVLYDVAKGCIGKDMSPKDIAPDALGCAESLNGVYKKAFNEELLADVVSTAALYKHLMKDSRVELVSNDKALPGDIVISPTGTSTKGAKHGHTGIRGFEAYMSNDSDSGLWLANYNLPNWKLVFHDTLGFPIYHFRVK